MRLLQAASFFSLLSVLTAQPSSGPCAACHPAETAAYNRTRMSSAMLPANQSAFAASAEGLSLHEQGDGYRFVYRQTKQGLQVDAFKGDDSAQAVIDWVLGSGAQGQTPIVRAGDRYFESRVSYFPALHRYGITVGQTAAASTSALSSLGREKTPAELLQCMRCHAVLQNADTTRPLPGVQCEQCHPGASAHVTGKVRPINPGKLTAIQQVMLCGNCHRNTPPVGEGELENVRFQPLRLMKSACFASAKLSCTTCHPAHLDARRQDAAFYNAKCVVCHAGEASHVASQRSANCIGCHMPQIQLHPALRFTDHFIRIVNLSDYPAGTVVQRPGEHAE